MSKIDIEKLIYKKPSLAADMNTLLNVHYSGNQEEPIIIPSSGTTSKDTGHLDPSPTPGTNP